MTEVLYQYRREVNQLFSLFFFIDKHFSPWSLLVNKVVFSALVDLLKEKNKKPVISVRYTTNACI